MMKCLSKEIKTYNIMTTKKAILVQLAVFLAIMPCMLVLNESEHLITNFLGLVYAFLLCAWTSCTQTGRKWLRMAENANKVLFGSMSGE